MIYRDDNIHEALEKVGATRATKRFIKGKFSSPYEASRAGVSINEAHQKGRKVSQLVSQWKRSGRGKDSPLFQKAKKLVEEARISASGDRKIYATEADIFAKRKKTPRYKGSEYKAWDIPGGTGPSSKLRNARHKQHKRLWEAKEKGAYIPWQGLESITPFSRGWGGHAPSSGKGRFLKAQKALKSVGE
mgnify:CR=1 FL=1